MTPDEAVRATSGDGTISAPAQSATPAVLGQHRVSRDEMRARLQAETAACRATRRRRTTTPESAAPGSLWAMSSVSPQQAVPVRVELLISTMRTGVMCISRRELRPSGQCGQCAGMDVGEALATQAQTLMGENVSLANVEQASTGDTPAAPLRRTGHPGGDRQTARGQARLRLAAAPLGRRADLCLDWAQPPAEQGL